MPGSAMFFIIASAIIHYSMSSAYHSISLCIIVYHLFEDII